MNESDITTHVRTFALDLDEAARASVATGRTIDVQAVPYGTAVPIPSEGIRERFAFGAFTHQLPAMHRVVATYRHQSQGGEVIGRLGSGNELASGLRVAMQISDTRAGNDTLTLVRDGAVGQVSIGFRSKREWSRLDGGVTERVKANLFEVALLPEGAYGRHASVIGVRSMDAMFATMLDGDPDEIEDGDERGLDLEAARALVLSIPILSSVALAG